MVLEHAGTMLELCWNYAENRLENVFIINVYYYRLQWDFPAPEDIFQNSILVLKEEYNKFNINIYLKIQFSFYLLQ